MSKRNASSTKRPAKRAKKTHTFGATSTDDEDALTSQLNAPSSTSLATRTLPPDYVPALTTLCARVFVANLKHLFEQNQEETQEWLKVLPDPMIPPLFSMLRAKHPSLLTHPFISTYFLRGDQVVLSSTLPGVTPATVQAISKLGANLRNLQLIGLDKISDEVFEKLLLTVTSLEILVLRGCSKVNRKTVKAACMSSKTLKTVNLNYTASITALSYLTAECRELEVLKLAGVAGITDGIFTQILHLGERYESRPLQKLRSLKLRYANVSEFSLQGIFVQCPLLSRLDVSFTRVRRPTCFLHNTAEIKLSKLSLNSTRLDPSFLQAALRSQRLPTFILGSLHTLHIGALGSSPSSTAGTFTTLHTFTDDVLDSLTDILTQSELIENISLVGNTKLGMRLGKTSALARFLRNVGRRCKVLNLAGIQRLTSSDLAGLIPFPETEITVDDISSSSTREAGVAHGPSPLRILILNGTDLGDKASEYISACADLQTLEIAGTKIGYHALFDILDSCPRLTSLDLTSCRGIKIRDRRNFFQVWEREWKDN